MDTIAVYRLRSDALKLNNYLNKQRLACTIISTPSYLRSGCGLSVVFNHSYKQQVLLANKKLGLNSFLGFYAKN